MPPVTNAIIVLRPFNRRVRVNRITQMTLFLRDKPVEGTLCLHKCALDRQRVSQATA